VVKNTPTYLKTDTADEPIVDLSVQGRGGHDISSQPTTEPNKVVSLSISKVRYKGRTKTLKGYK
jgi:hypothetical protein